VDADDLLERLKRHGAVAANDAGGGADTGAIDEDRGRAEEGDGGIDGGLGSGGICHVAGESCAAGFGGDGGSLVGVAVEDGDIGARGCEGARGGGAQARGGAGDDGGLAGNVHYLASGFSMSRAIPCPPP